MEYYLMNKDEKILSFQTKNSLGIVQIKEEQRYQSKLPIGFLDIGTWIEQRNYAKHKEHFKNWLKEWGMHTTEGFIEATHCLSLNDTLWVKPVDSYAKWEQVSLYQNDFADVAARTAFETGLHGIQLSSTSPEFTADGSFPKFWKREGNEIYLYKAGGSGAVNVGLEPYSEYLASGISAQVSNIPVTSYDLQKVKGSLVSVCRMFTSEDYGFVPAYRVFEVGKQYNIPEVISRCKEMGFEREAAEMFFLDSIVFNQDRHLGNFGFLFNNNTFEIVGFSPLYDFNISMLCNAMPEDLADPKRYFAEYRVGHKLGGDFAQVGREIAKEYGFKVPSYLALPHHERYNLSQKRLESMEKIVNGQLFEIQGKGKFHVVGSKSSVRSALKKNVSSLQYKDKKISIKKQIQER